MEQVRRISLSQSTWRVRRRRAMSSLGWQREPITSQYPQSIRRASLVTGRSQSPRSFRRLFVQRNADAAVVRSADRSAMGGERLHRMERLRSTAQTSCCPRGTRKILLFNRQIQVVGAVRASSDASLCLVGAIRRDGWGIRFWRRVDRRWAWPSTRPLRYTIGIAENSTLSAR